MNNRLILIALVIALFTACNSDDYDAPNSFSDVSWYTSGFRDTIVSINVNDFASFSDLSQGEISHKWTIEEGSYYLKGPIKRKDSIYDDFIITPQSLESTDKTVHVLFKEGGLKKVNLYNEFKEYVEFKGADGFVFPSKEVGGKWVIDTTFVVDVYDTIVPQILIRQNGVVVPHELESDVITVEAGSTLEFVDITTIGRPNTRAWQIGDITSTDSLAVIQLNQLGSFKGGLNISRQGENIPADYDRYNIAATINVVPSSLPFEVAGDLVELENQTIQIPYNGEFKPFADQKAHFTVNVNGTPFTISTIGLNSSNATILEIKLQEQIYRSDNITVSYDGNGTLESTDTRIPAAFTDLPVQMYQHEAVRYDIEDGGANWTTKDDNLPTTTVAPSTEQAASGQYSIKVDAAQSGPWSGFHNVIDQYTLTAGVTYQLEYKIYKQAGAVINMNGPWIQKDGETVFQFWNNIVATAAEDTWVTVSPAQRFTAATTGSDYEIYLRHNGMGVIYFDDIRIMEVDERP
ncbi:hypothetical protein [Cellulophaga omnivescoria]|uniref:hypothetical protein n=1 Tax=Cellulophaga omnivescoria TaxID=1888890 RepID=UPI000985941B|nr:hypothetical protein [Cellulophaga omnivescoria]WKB81971.1 hypothetical protein QYR09_02785 [Cellulophaga lytica]